MAIVNNIYEACSYIESNHPNMICDKIVDRISGRIPHYPINISYCADEYNGKRFGQRDIRKDLNPIKISSGGRNKTSWKAYQLWIWEIK